jgi:hypothetical protein
VQRGFAQAPLGGWDPIGITAIAASSRTKAGGTDGSGRSRCSQRAVEGSSELRASLVHSHRTLRAGTHTQLFGVEGMSVDDGE